MCVYDSRQTGVSKVIEELSADAVILLAVSQCSMCIIILIIIHNIHAPCILKDKSKIENQFSFIDLIH